MTDALAVRLNRADHHAIEPASDSFETDGAFVVRIENHGEGSHLHCSLSGELASTATVLDGNPFLEPDDVVEIPVDVNTDLRPARGALELSTGYGQAAVTIDVLVREQSDGSTGPVDPAAPPERTPADASGDSDRSPDATEFSLAGTERLDDLSGALRDRLPRRDAGTGLLAVVSVLAILIAVGTWQVVEGPVVLLAVLVVLATVLGASVALVRS